MSFLGKNQRSILLVSMVNKHKLSNKIFLYNKEFGVNSSGFGGFKMNDYQRNTSFFC